MKPILFALLLCGAALAQNAHDNGPATYLALGDSVAFGYFAPPFQPPQNYVGYPEVLSQTRQLPKLKKLESLACPGETSGSFLSVAAPDNGCQQWKHIAPLHTDYGLQSQGSFALYELQANRKIDLVTINIGGNDLLLLQQACNNVPLCILQGLSPVLDTYEKNLTSILKLIRTDAGFKDQVILLTYFSPNYTDPIQTAGIAALNAKAAMVARRFNVDIADGFGAFLAASLRSGGDPCAAGLMVRLTATTCDVHPSPAGQALLAGAVARAYDR